MKTKPILIDKNDLQGPFLTPPVNGGQIVETSYACTEDYILERTFDRSDRSEKIVAYHWPASGAPFDPWNGVPETGRRAGSAVLLG